MPKIKSVYKLVRIDMPLLGNGQTASIEKSEVFFTEDEIDAIYDAMGDYQDYGDDECEMSFGIRVKISELA